MADHHHLAFVVILGGQPPDHGLDSQGREQGRRGARNEEAFHLLSGAHGGLPLLEEAEILERLCALPVLDEELRPRAEFLGKIGAWSRGPDRDEPVRFREGERVEQHGIDDAEDRGARSDSERESRYRDGGEAGTLEQGP